MATFDEWLDAYEPACRSLPAGSGTPCPNCARTTLRLVFTAPPRFHVGYASLWCDTCLEGILICRATLPPGAVVRSTEVPPEDREPRIPNYRLVS